MTDFAKEVQDRRHNAEEGDKENREEALLDLKFEAGEHWDERVKQYREEQGVARYGFPLPCLTINDLPQKTGQVIGDRKANATSIKVLPREDGDKNVAEVRSELIRSIELQSKADRVYSAAFRQAVGCGIGNFRVDLDYAYEDAFDRDLFIRGIPNPLAVTWDPLSADPTGRDAEYCFVDENIPKEEYKRKFKDAPEIGLLERDLKGTGWITDNTVRIAEYWKIVERPRTFALLVDGSTVDITDKGIGAIDPTMIAINPEKNEPYVREALCKYAVMTVTNGKDELSDPLELKIPRLPVIRVMGREIWVGDRRVRFGLVRFARDPARLKDVFRSITAEKLLLSPRHNFLAQAKSVKGREKDWPNTLVYNDQTEAPIETTQNNLAAYLNEAAMCSQDMKDVTGLHDASLGIQSNETSGVAIRARQHEGDIATIDYHDNMNAAMQEAGEVLNALIPIVYDTARTIRTVGIDDSVKLIRINDPNFQPNEMVKQNIDIGVGKYDVAITTGPAYMTKRIEAAAQLTEMAGQSPKLLEVAGDLVVKALDIPDGDEIAARIKNTIPPEVLGEEEEETDEQRAVKAEAQAMQRELQMLAHRKAVAETEKAEADALTAKKAAEDALNGLNKQTVDATNAETNRIKAITAKDFPLPPSAQAILAPLVTQAVMNVLASPDVLPLGMQLGIAAEAFDDAIQPEITPEQGIEEPIQ